MALPRQSVSINLAGALDTKTDSKLAANTSVLTSQNLIYKKIGRSDKRKGYDSLATTVSAPSYAPSFGSNSDIKNNIAQHLDQLVLQNNGALYARDTVNSRWDHVANALPCQVSSENAIASLFSQYDVDYVDFGSYRALLYLEVENGKNAPTSNNLPLKNIVNCSFKYKILDLTSKKELYEATLQTFKTTPDGLYSRFIGGVKALKIASNDLFFIFSYVDYGQISTTAIIKSAKISSTDFSVLSTYTALSSSPNSNPVMFDALVLPSTSAIGEKIALGYGLDTFTKVIFLETNNTLSTQPEYDFSGSISQATTFPSLYYDANISTSKLFFAIGKKCDTLNTPYTAGKIYLSRLALAVGSTTEDWLATYTADSDEDVFFYPNVVDIIKHPTSSDILVYFDISGAFGTINSAVYGETAKTYVMQVNSVGTITDDRTLVAGANIVSKAIHDSSRSTHYLILGNVSVEEASYFLVDVFKGLSTTRPAVVARFEYGAASNDILTRTKKASMSGRDVTCYLPYRQKIESAYATVLSANPDQYSFLNSIKEYTLALSASQAVHDIFANKSTILPSGLLHQYDGVNLFENNFLASPQRIVVAYPQKHFQTSVAGGGGSNYMVTSVVGHGALYSESISLLYKTLSFSIAGGGTYRIYLNPPTTQTAVAPNVAVNVYINDTDSADEVAQKIANAVNNEGTCTATTGSSIDAGGEVIITSNSAGVAPNPSSQGVFGAGGINSSGFPSTFVSGTKTIIYAAVFEFTDNQGNIHTSSPVFSDPVEYTTAILTFPSLLITCPQLTNKDISKVEVKVYRSNGTTDLFYLFSSRAFFREGTGASSSSVAVGGRIFMEEGVPKVTLLDTAWDSTAQDELLEYQSTLYTTGGIQENVTLSSCKMSCDWNNRLAVVDNDDPYTIAYSKKLQNGVAPEFTDANRISISKDARKITAIGAFDDKIFGFKSDKIYYCSGDGLNDQGTQISLSEPSEIPGDVGAIEDSPVVKFPEGLIFKSSKGIYLLDRSLQIRYIGAPVEDFNQYTISSAVLIKDLNEIRFTFSDTDSLLAYNYLLDRWSEHTNCGADDATVYNGSYARVKNSGSVKVENSSRFTDQNDALSGNTSYNQVLETSWIKLNLVQDYQRLYEFLVLGNLKSAHTLQCIIQHNYDTSVANQETITFDSTVISGGSGIDASVYQALFKPARQKSAAVKLKFTVIPNGGTEEGLEMTDLSLLLGLKGGLTRVSSDKVN
jgi:hypothetical protein